MPATPADVSEAVAYMLNFADIRGKGANDAVKAAHIRAIAKRGYSRAELMLAMDELPFRNTYGEGFRLDILDEIVKEHREMRARLSRMLTAKERDEITDTFPEIDAKCFHVAGFDGKNEPLYRYVDGRPAPDVPVTPLLEESVPNRRESGGLVSIKDAVSHQTKQGDTGAAKHARTALRD